MRDTDAQVFAVPGLGSAWQPALRGLDTGWIQASAPDHVR